MKERYTSRGTSGSKKSDASDQDKPHDPSVQVKERVMSGLSIGEIGPHEIPYWTFRIAEEYGMSLDEVRRIINESMEDMRNR